MPRLVPCLLALVLLLHGSLAAALETRRIPPALDPVINRLLTMVGANPSTDLDPAVVAPLVEFVAARKNPDTLYQPEALEQTTTAYYQFDLAIGMDRLLAYAYNPDIPSQMFSPSSLRTARRLPDASGREVTWAWREATPRPQIVQLAEHEEITPDLFTGAYYGYDIDRTLILFSDGDGRRIFLSLGRQRDQSEVGRKGAVLGDDHAWDFLYSDATGLTSRGLGWVKSYIYRSLSLTVFVQEPGAQGVRCGSFKWLNAGWAGINMVEPKHIHRGMERYATDLRRLIENPRLPAPEKMAADLKEISEVDDRRLRDLMDSYMQTISRQYAAEAVLSRSEFAALFDETTEVMDRTQMLAVLELEYLKTLLGRPQRLPLKLAAVR
ncbi:MAG: hypothetical protein AB1568_11900 [Thermodesulfobacteriota bacterium]